MLTGQRVFKGDDISEVPASVIKDTPSQEALPAVHGSSIPHPQLGSPAYKCVRLLVFMSTRYRAKLRANVTPSPGLTVY